MRFTGFMKIRADFPALLALAGLMIWLAAQSAGAMMVTLRVEVAARWRDDGVELRVRARNLGNETAFNASPEIEFLGRQMNFYQRDILPDGIPVVFSNHFPAVAPLRSGAYPVLAQVRYQDDNSYTHFAPGYGILRYGGVDKSAPDLEVAWSNLNITDTASVSIAVSGVFDGIEAMQCILHTTPYISVSPNPVSLPMPPGGVLDFMIDLVNTNCVGGTSWPLIMFLVLDQSDSQQLRVYQNEIKIENTPQAVLHPLSGSVGRHGRRTAAIVVIVLIGFAVLITACVRAPGSYKLLKESGRWRYYVMALLAVMVLLIAWLVWRQNYHGEVCEAAQINPQALIDSINDAADYLVRNCDANGRFNYLVNPGSNADSSEKYNVLRHAGTIYALAMYQDVFPHPEVARTIRQSAKYLHDNAIRPVEGQDDMSAVWSDPEITGKNAPIAAKLGGAGLALLALVSADDVLPGLLDLNLAREIGNFIIFMQKSDGRFYSKYFQQTKCRDDAWTSLYYPGEAALGLLMLYRKDPHDKWLQAAHDAIVGMAELRRLINRYDPDHWALLATAELLPYYDKIKKPVPRELLIQHAVRICELMLANPPDYPAGSPEFGSFMEDGATCPTAIRLEGLISALSFLPEGNAELREAIAVRVSHGVQFMMNSQVKSGVNRGGIPRASRVLPEGHPQYSEKFNARAAEIRIDYVQHALSGFIKYYQTHTNYYQSSNSAASVRVAL